MHVYSSTSPPTASPSDIRERVANCAVALFVSAVNQPSLRTPLLVCGYVYPPRARRVRKRAKKAKMKTLALESQFKAWSVQSGNFSARKVESSQRSCPAVRLKRAFSYSSVLRCLQLLLRTVAGGCSAESDISGCYYSRRYK